MALGPGQGHLCRGAAASELGVRGEGRRRGHALAVAAWSVGLALPLPDSCLARTPGPPSLLCPEGDAVLGGPSWVQWAVSDLLLSGRFYLVSGGVPFIICGVTAATNIRNYGTEGEESA